MIINHNINNIHNISKEGKVLDRPQSTQSGGGPWEHHPASIGGRHLGTCLECVDLGHETGTGDGVPTTERHVFGRGLRVREE